MLLSKVSYRNVMHVHLQFQITPKAVHPRPEDIEILTSQQANYLLISRSETIIICLVFLDCVFICLVRWFCTWKLESGK